MLTNEQYLLTKAAEEGAEIAQIALKCQQFGLHEVEPGRTESNAQRLYGELNDLLGVIEKMNEEIEGFEYIVDDAALEAKSRKIDHYRKYSQSIGLVEV